VYPREIRRLLALGHLSQNEADDLLDRFNYAARIAGEHPTQENPTMQPDDILKAFDAGDITQLQAKHLLDRFNYAARIAGAHPTQGDPTMNAELIFTSLDNGTITRDSAIELLIKHSRCADLIEAYLECRTQRREYRDQLHAEQDRDERPHMMHDTIEDLIDHAFLTDHIGPVFARTHLISAGMDADTARHHVETLQAEKAHDAERANYLEFPEHAPRYCTRCGRLTTADKISNRGICNRCGLEAQAYSKYQIKRRQGPYFHKWRKGILAFAYILETQEIAERHDLTPTTTDDLIDHDKYPGCDAECDLCPDTECPFRDTLSDTG